MEPTRRFVDLVSGPEDEIELDEAALLVAAHAHPDLDVPAERARLDGIADKCDGRDVDGLRELLFERLGFDGNTGRYHDPRNSYLNDVLDRRTGIPISLSVLTIEVARRLDVPLVGIGMPGHFLVRHADDAALYLDPFHRGQVLDEEGARALFQRVQGDGARFDPAFLAPVGPRAILARMLANLKMVYAARRDFASAEWAIRLRLAIPGVPRSEACELAVAVGSQGRFREAARELEALASVLPDEKTDDVLRRARSLRARLN